MSSESLNGNIKEVQEHIGINGRFLVIASLVICIIGIIMVIEWFLFSNLIQKFAENKT